MIEIDGSCGEGGGQVLRTSLSLSMITGKPFRIERIRAQRSKPGLRHQHLTAVKAAQEVCQAEVQGAELHSQKLEFIPGKIRSGQYEFRIPTAGSTGLVLQTIFLPLAWAEKPSRVRITGGTHVAWSPCYHYLAWHWLPHLERIGFGGEISLSSAGYYPQGGGEIQMVIAPCQSIRPLTIPKRGSLKHIRGLSALSNLPRHIIRRQRDRVVSRLGRKYPLQDVRLGELPSPGKGTVMLLLAEFAHSQACYFSLGRKGVRAEEVADQVVDQFLAFLESDGAVDEYLADQLMLSLAFAKGASEIAIPEVTSHMKTNAEIIGAFLPREFSFQNHCLRIAP